MKFDFDENKAQENLKKHGVSFEEAAQAFNDENGIESFDEINSDSEIRYRLIALSPIRLLFVAYTILEDEDEEIIRLISVRRATVKETEFYTYVNR